MKTRRRVIQGACAVAAAVGNRAVAAVQAAEFRHGKSWFRLRIVGYQFPDATDLDDANWLMISGECSLEGRQWTFTDPCLETWDMEELASWLEALAAGRNTKPFLAFTEPNLEFQVVKGNTLRVIFSLETAPEKDFRAPESKRRFDMPITPDLAATAKCLRDQSHLFPPKGKRA
jgi:hypothetical protein